MLTKTDRVICGTCEYWTGARNPTFNRKSVPKINIIDRYGECENPQSKFFEQKRKVDLKCICFYKWTEIL